ncbi:hypothetical protein DPMN_163566 [Dreissena polymorpha]|uniref:Uncharacterized protein n=1 Tax=Dreissena polymorpha TaxID=45954 RepID=A0A9D4ETI6_DREPO|nr:hypothetical protein DPMN_163566 [Dreissena polymorpha]
MPMTPVTALPLILTFFFHAHATVTALPLIPTFLFHAHDTNDSAPSNTNLLLPCP